MPEGFEYHKDLTGAEIHVPGYTQATDPGAVGVSKYWIDTTSGAGAWILKVRNVANTGWEVIAGSETMSHAQLNDMPDTGGINTDHDARYYTETEINTALDLKADKTTIISAGVGLLGGGDISTNRILAVDTSLIATIAYVNAQNPELYWDRPSGGITIMPFTPNDSLDMGSGNITTSGTLDSSNMAFEKVAGKLTSITPVADLDDMSVGGTPTALAYTQYRVQIDLAAGTDTFKWSNDNGSSWEVEDVTITGSAQTLENGIEVTFGATTGHTLGDKWDFDVGTVIMQKNPVYDEDFLFGSPQLADDGDTDHDKRMWFDKSKGAFRVGRVTGDDWDDSNVGNYSVAMGNNSTASGTYSTAIGSYATASGSSSIAMGGDAIASGNTSIAMGSSSEASGPYSITMGASSTATAYAATAMGYYCNATASYATAMGGSTAASGFYSMAMGNQTTAQAFASTVLGRYNVISGTTDSWEATEPVFVIGIGASAGSPANAMTVLKNGNIGIGVTDPHSKLEVNGAISTGQGLLVASDQTENAYDVSGINCLMIDCSGPASVTIGGFSGGVAGQFLHVMKIDDTAGEFAKLTHGSGAGTQKIYLHAGADETLTANYGGWQLGCDGTSWFDASHSKHVP